MKQKERKLLQITRDELQQMQDCEQEKYDNAPEGLESSERYERIQEIADSLQEAVGILDGILED